MEEVDRFFGTFIMPSRFTGNNAPRDPLFMWACLRSEFPLLFASLSASSALPPLQPKQSASSVSPGDRLSRESQAKHAAAACVPFAHTQIRQ
jgi:hypothetical protein